VKIREQQAALRGPAGGSAVIEGTEVRVSSRIAARVVKVAVAEGQRVETGQLLVELDCADPKALLAEAEARLAAARAQAEAAQAVVLQARHGTGAAKKAASAAAAQADAIRAQREATERQAARLEAMGKDVPIAQLDQTRATAEGLARQAEAASESGQASAQQALAAESQISVAAANAQAAARTVGVAEAAVARAKIMVAECTLNAPRSGVVEVIAIEPGELAAPGAVLLRLSDISRVEAAFYLPNAELAAAQAGGAAMVEADAYPGEKFEGRIARVATEAEFTPRNIQTRSDRDRLVYRVEVTIENPAGKLRPGMPVQVTLPGTEPREPVR
jgi:HlyD family secretion protein